MACDLFARKTQKLIKHIGCLPWLEVELKYLLITKNTQNTLHYRLRGDMDKKGAKNWQKQTSVSHSINSPGDICCTFRVGYDPYFAQKKKLLMLVQKICPKLQQMYKKVEYDLSEG